MSISVQNGNRGMFQKHGLFFSLRQIASLSRAIFRHLSVVFHHLTSFFTTSTSLSTLEILFFCRLNATTTNLKLFEHPHPRLRIRASLEVLTLERAPSIKTYCCGSYPEQYFPQENPCLAVISSPSVLGSSLVLVFLALFFAYVKSYFRKSRFLRQSSLYASSNTGSVSSSFELAQGVYFADISRDY